MDTYVILRRGGWPSVEELELAAERSTAEGERLGTVRWLRSYVLAERDAVGTVCVYQAESPEAIREHASRARLPVDEIVRVADTVVMGPDPTPADAG